MKKNSKRNILVCLLLGVALFLRMYKIGDTAQFLGDQGRDGLAIQETFAKNILPNVGPTVGAGYYTGPLYYYLIAPSYLLFPNAPIAPIIEMCIIGVMAIALFLYVATLLFGFEIAYIVSILWALSPLMIMQDRRLWNPTPIPFFVLLLIVSLLWVTRQKKYWGYITAAVASSALLQLHYVNVISIVFVLCIWAVSIWRGSDPLQKKLGKKQLPWMIGGVCLVIVLVSPFLWYEIQHNFKDVIGSIATFVHGNNQVFSKRAYVTSLGKTAAALTSYSIALKNSGVLLVIAAVVLFVNILKKKAVGLLCAMWFGFGIILLSFYKDTMQPQYIYQLIPVVFLLVAGVLSTIHKRLAVIVSMLAVISISCISWALVPPYQTNDPDLPRVSAIAKKIPQVVTEPFSFVLMHSRSFNDLHIRYFFHLYGIQTVPYDDPSYTTLVLICENTCFDKPNERVLVTCSSEICPFDKSDVDFNRWRYVKTERVGTAAIYLYTR